MLRSLLAFRPVAAAHPAKAGEFVTPDVVRPTETSSNAAGAVARHGKTVVPPAAAGACYAVTEATLAAPTSKEEKKGIGVCEASVEGGTYTHTNRTATNILEEKEKEKDVLKTSSKVAPGLQPPPLSQTETSAGGFSALAGASSASEEIVWNCCCWEQLQRDKAAVQELQLEERHVDAAHLVVDLLATYPPHFIQNEKEFVEPLYRYLVTKHIYVLLGQHAAVEKLLQPSSVRTNSSSSSNNSKLHLSHRHQQRQHEEDEEQEEDDDDEKDKNEEKNSTKHKKREKKEIEGRDKQQEAAAGNGTRRRTRCSNPTCCCCCRYEENILNVPSSSSFSSDKQYDASQKQPLLLTTFSSHAKGSEGTNISNKINNSNNNTITNNNSSNNNGSKKGGGKSNNNSSSSSSSSRGDYNNSNIDDTANGTQEKDKEEQEKKGKKNRAGCMIRRYCTLDATGRCECDALRPPLISMSSFESVIDGVAGAAAGTTVAAGTTDAVAAAAGGRGGARAQEEEDSQENVYGDCDCLSIMTETEEEEEEEEEEEGKARKSAGGDSHQPTRENNKGEEKRKGIYDEEGNGKELKRREEQKENSGDKERRKEKRECGEEDISEQKNIGNKEINEESKDGVGDIQTHGTTCEHLFEGDPLLQKVLPGSLLEAALQQAVHPSVIGRKPRAWRTAYEDDKLKVWVRDYEDNRELLSFRIEGWLDAPLLDSLSVLAEVDLFKQWTPYFSTPFRLGLREVNRHLLGRVEQLVHFHVDFPWPFASRDAFFEVWAVDDLERNGHIVVKATTLSEDLPCVRRDITAPRPAKGVERMCVDGGIIIFPVKQDCTYARLLWHENSRISLPVKLVDFVSTIVSRIGFSRFRHACQVSAKEETYRRRRLHNRYLYGLIEKRLEELGLHTTENSAEEPGEENGGTKEVAASFLANGGAGAAVHEPAPGAGFAADAAAAPSRAIVSGV